MSKIPSEYRGLPISRKEKHSLWGWINASYHVKTKSIVVYDRMEKKTPEEIELVLFHEWCHHIYMTKVNKLAKFVWKLINNGRLIPVLNIFWITEYKENKHVSGAAKANDNEWFARSCAQWYDHWEYNNYLDDKIKLARAMLDYFSK